MSKREMKATEFVTEPLRLAFPSLFKKRAVSEGGRETFGATILIGPDVDLKPFKRAINAAIREKWGKPVKKGSSRFVKVGKKRLKLKLPVKSAEEKAGQWEGFEEDGFYVNASSGMRVGVVDAKARPVTDEDDVYGGCWCKFWLTAFTWTNDKGGAGVSFSLNAVQKVKDDERFGGSYDPSEVFEPVDLDDDDDEDFDDDDEEFEDDDAEDYIGG